MSDARMATWAAALPKNPYNVWDVHALFQLPPTSKHLWMGFSLTDSSLGTRLCHIRAWHWPVSPNHVHGHFPQGPNNPHRAISSSGMDSGVTTPSCSPLVVSVLPWVVSTRAPTCSASASRATLDPTVSGKDDGTRVSETMHSQVLCSHCCGRSKVVLVETSKETVGSVPSVLCSSTISFRPFQPSHALLPSALLIYCVFVGVLFSCALP